MEMYALESKFPLITPLQVITAKNFEYIFLYCYYIHTNSYFTIFLIFKISFPVTVNIHYYIHFKCTI